MLLTVPKIRWTNARLACGLLNRQTTGLAGRRRRRGAAAILAFSRLTSVGCDLSFRTLLAFALWCPVVAHARFIAP